MTIQQILDTIVEDRGPIILAIVILMTLIQITPIKFNPWSALLGWIGKYINKGLFDKFDTLEKRMDDMEKQLSEHIEASKLADLKARRAAILDFGSSLLRGINYHKEKFAFMVAECDSYEQYCQENKIHNGIAAASIEEIRKAYKEHLHNNDFLQDSFTYVLSSAASHTNNDDDK